MVIPTRPHDLDLRAGLVGDGNDVDNRAWIWILGDDVETVLLDAQEPRGPAVGGGEAHAVVEVVNGQQRVHVAQRGERQARGEDEKGDLPVGVRQEELAAVDEVPADGALQGDLELRERISLQARGEKMAGRELELLEERVAGEDEGARGAVRDDGARRFGDGRFLQGGGEADQLAIHHVQVVDLQPATAMVLADEGKADGLVRGGEELDVANAQVGDVNVERSEGVQFAGQRNDLQ